MRKQIRSQLIKMLVLMGCLTGLVIFAWDFVYAGMMAKIYLNGFICCVFAFGVVMAFRNVTSLRNEELAFSALVEAYNDIKRDVVADSDDPYWRHYRCLEPGYVFHRPRLLGHFFEIVYEELLRTKNLRISIVTMQNLVQGVESKLAEERSLVSYLSGLLVFLGLIGAFIGLMQMVQSVGGIVGGLSGTDPATNADGFGRLISQLQGPLSGMAIGFSSSLFGLCGSLTLGLLSRLAAQAGTVLKTEFASWLANVVQIEGGDSAVLSSDGGFKGVISQGTATKQLADAAATMSHSLAQSQTSYEKMLAMLERVSHAQADQATATSKLSVQMAHFVTLQEEIKGNLLRSNTQGAGIVGAKDELLRLGHSMETLLGEGFAQLANAIEAYQRVQTENVEHLVTMQEHLAQRSDVVAQSVQAQPAPIGAPQIETAVETAIARALTQLPHFTAGDVELTREQAAQLAETRARLQTLSEEGGLDELREQVKNLESNVASGFNDVTRAVETIFATYAEKLPRAPQGPHSHQTSAERAAAASPHAAIVEGEVQPVEPVDHEEMIRRLYSKVAEHYQPTGSES